MPLPLKGLKKLQLPARCEICGLWPSSPVCPACIKSFAKAQQRCPLCALMSTVGARPCGTCLVNPPATAQCLAAISYEFPWVQCIARFKFGGQPGWAQSLAQIMRQSPGMQEALDQADWVIPMPLSAQRLLQRGYNQAWELARRLSPQKARADLLIRLRDTPAQSQLNRDQRLRNLLGALMVAPATARLLKNSRVLIVDDVMTTGASIQAATEVLKSAGTAWTGACVLARTERPDL